MPRSSRIMSNTGIYHTLLRGINQQRIFEEESDYKYFLAKLVQIKKETGILLFGYCIMSNHVHLLLKESETRVVYLFRRLGLAISQMDSVSGAKNASQFQKLAAGQQRSAVCAVRNRGLSIRQIARISGISKGVVERWVRTTAGT